MTKDKRGTGVYGYEGTQDYGGEPSRSTKVIGVIVCALIFAALAAFIIFKVKTSPVTANATANVPVEITSIYWSDGDSGRINGTLKFRLNDIDAPETGGVGAAIGGAKCELERERGYEAKAWVVEFTRDADLSVSKTYDTDRHGRVVIDLTVGGEDIGGAGVGAGHYQPWPHDGKKALARRPVWCGQ